MPTRMQQPVTHQHTRRFLGAMAVALIVGILLLFAGSRREPIKNLQEEIDRALETSLDLLKADDLAGAETHLRKVVRKLDGLRRKRETNGENVGTVFDDEFAEASYLLAATQFRRFEAKHADEIARATVDRQERFVPPPEEIRPIRDVVRGGLEADETHPRLWRLLGVIDTMRGQYAEAETALEKAVHNDPHFAEAYNDLGLVYLKQRRFELAREFFEKALLAGDKDATPPAAAHFNLGLFYANLERGFPEGSDRAKAIRHLEAYLEAEGQPEASRNVAKTYLERLQAQTRPPGVLLPDESRRAAPTRRAAPGGNKETVR